MSAYENVVVGKLKLKGKALELKPGGITKKKKEEHDRTTSLLNRLLGGNIGLSKYHIEEAIHENDKDGGEGQAAMYEDHLTPAERRFLQQREKIELKMLAKMASKSHRDRVQEFNQYLANLSEHYDIPKVGPG